jgi:hypothetical protein
MFLTMIQDLPRHPKYEQKIATMFFQHVKPAWFENTKSILLKCMIRLLPMMSILVAFLLMFPDSVLGATKIWVPTTGGAWTTAANWNPSGAPADGDDVFINSDQSATITAVPTRSLLSLTINGNCTFQASANTNTLTVTGALTVASGKTLTLGSSNTTRMYFILASGATGNIQGVISIYGRTFTNSGNLTLSASGYLSGGGSFTLNSGATLQIGSINGITSTASTGNIQVTGTRTYNGGAYYIYNGTSAQVTGNELPTTITGGLTINNSLGVTLSQSTTISGTYTPTAGALNISSNYTLALSGTTSCGSGSIYATNGTVSYSSTALNILSGTYYNLLLSATATHTACGNIIVNSGTLTNAANSVLDMSTYVLSGTGTFTNNGTIKTSCLTATSATPIPTGKTWAGTIQYAATTGSQTIVAATSYTNLTLLNASGTNTAAAAITVSGTFTTTAGGTLDMGTYALSVPGTVANSGIIKTSNTSATPITTGKTWGGTVEYAINSGSQTIMTATYNNLTLDNSSGTNTTAGVITVSGAFTTTSGGTLSTAYNIVLNGTSTCGGSISASAGTVTYAATALNVLAGTYYNLTLSGAGTYTLCGVTAVSNTFTSSGTIGLTNNLTFSTSPTCGGTISATAGTVTYPSTASNILAGTYYNLTLPGAVTYTLCGAVAANNTLTWNNGLIALTTYNFTLGSSSSITSGSSFSSTHMFQCNGASNTGSLIRQGDAVADFNMIYPIGNGTNYTPITISSLTATVTNPGSISVNTIPAYYSAGGAISSDLTRYWTVATNNLTGISSNVSFTYIAADVPSSGTESSYKTSFYSGGTWEFDDAVNTTGHIASASSISNLSGVWTARKPAATYYSYQSGPWSSSATWTTDASGTLSVNPAVPGAGDNVVILNGRTVTAQDAGRTIGSLEIREGGILDIGTITTHSFGVVRGQGKLRLNSSTFPTGTFDEFVTAGGGTVEYYNIGTTAVPVAISTVQLTYNNLIISNSTTTARSVYLSNASNGISYTINGNFDLKNSSTSTLTFNVGNPTASDNLINMNVYGNFTVSSGCTVGVNNFSSAHSIPNPTTAVLTTAPTYSYYPVHTLFLWGDFTNNGSVRFTGWPSPVNTSYYTLTTTDNGSTHYGHVQVYFKGSTNNTLTCNGITDFFRLVLEKGSDQTYALEVNSTSTSNFALYGPNNQGNSVNSGGPEGYGTGTYFKSLFIHYGTLKLNDNISIPTLTQGGEDLNIIPTAQLWINGATVYSTLNTGDPYYKSTTVYGKLRISSGSLNTQHATGLVLGSLGTPEIMLEGTGNLSICQFWAISSGSNKVSYIQTGGTLDVRMQGQYQSTANAMFDLSNTNSVFVMSGGIINFTNNQYVASYNGSYFYKLMDIEAQQGNYDVTGGTINFNLPNAATNYTFVTTVPFYNLNVSRNGTTGTTTIQANTNPLVVLNDLSIGTNSVLNMNSLNLNVGGDFTINGTYTTGTNTTTFDGAGDQMLDLEGACTFNHLALSGTSELTLQNANAATPIVTNGNFTLGSGCTLIDNGRILELNGSTGTTITNNGTHYKPASGAGSIRLTGTTAQIITGDGNGKFNNLTLYKTGGSVTMSSNMAITGDLRLAGTTNGIWNILNIGSNNLLLESEAVVYSTLNTTAQTFSNNRMIRTNGLMSDGGVSKRYSSTGAFMFPFGFYNTANTTYYYMPAKVQYTSAPSTYGTVTTRPVNAIHPLAQTTNILSCYWKTESDGFSGVAASTVKHVYYYNDYFVAGTETNYVPGFYSNSTFNWNYLNNTSLVYDTPDSIVYGTASAADGDFTAGYPAAFGSVTVLYSVADGAWNSSSTWNTQRGGGGASGVPNASTMALVVDNHTVTTTAANAYAGGLYIEAGSTLDLANFQGHNFEAIPNNKIAGSGTLRIGSSDYFPRGDFGNFIGENGGTVEYYTNATITSITVPTTSDVTALSLSTYKNLIVNTSAGSAHTITLPATNLTVYGNITVKGNGTTTATGVGTPGTTGRSYTIEGNLNVNSGLLEFRNPVVNTITVKGNTRISSGAAFSTNTNVTASIYPVLNLYGNLTNFGTFDMYNTGQVNANFIGTVNDTIRGTGSTYDFYTLTCNKGIDTTAILSLRAAITTHSSASSNFLTLNNGTFRVDTSTVSVVISTINAFSIPSTACFSVKSGTATIGTSNDAGDVSLSGKLEVIGGTLNVGNATGYNNDIEYAAAGTPTITVLGGALNVRGQIRRLISNTSGSLIYNQSGGDVIIYGQNNQATRAKMEITNSGRFVMSDGTITLRSAGGTTFYDLYLRPESDSVTGGTFYLGDASSTSGLTFGMVSEAPLWNVVVGTSSVSETAQLNVLPITVLNHLTISNNSVFNANGFNVTLGGNLTNNNSDAGTDITTGGFQAGSLAQITTFNGTSAQVITGNGSNLTNFAHLVLNNTGSTNTLTLASGSDIRINSDLTITAGTFADAGNTIYLAGDVDNNGIHTSSAATGGIAFVGSLQQTISGNGLGVFGNVILNNPLGIDMIDNSVINGKLTFTSGSIYVDDYLLTLGANATIGGTTGASNMIILNGVLSDRGIKKYFASGNTNAFTYPIGIAGKYTPATFDFSANSNSNGAITIIPVNDLHKSITTSPADYLNYYWDVNLSDFGSAYTVNYRFDYSDKDVHGNEANYIAQRYDAADNIWYSNRPTGTVTPASDYFSYASVSNYLDGEYTVGQAYTAQPILYSITNGNWATVGTWSTTQGGASCGCTPNGNPVEVVAGTTVTLATNTADAYSVVINGTLDASTTTFHDLGHVSGPGKLVLTATSDGMFVFPGGEYDDFMANTSSTVEFTGSTDGTLPLKPGNLYKPYQNVIFSDIGVKYMSAENLKINGNMIIRSVTSLNNTLYNKDIEILGNWTDEHTAASGFVPGTGMVTFAGTAAQNMVLGYTESFYNLTINNTHGVDMTTGNAGLTVSKNLYLTSGNFITATGKLITITNTSTSAIVGGSSSSFVDGPLCKNIISGQSFSFPVGDASRYGQINLVNTSVSSSPAYWTVAYNNVNPNTAGYLTGSSHYTSPISGVSDNEYWAVTRPTGGSANIQLRWDASSYPAFTSSSTLRTRLRIVEYASGTTLWTQRGATVSGTSTSGTISTSSPVTNDDYVFTIGVIGVTASITTNGLSYSICDNGEIAYIPVTLSGSSPWTLVYKATGTTTTTFTQTGITSASYQIALTGSNMGGYSATPYIISLVSVTDGSSTTGTVIANTASITVKRTYTPSITGAASVGTGETRTYSTTSHTGSTYAWSWVSTSLGTINTPTSASTTITFSSTAGGPYQLQVVETSSSGCTSSSVISITSTTTPTPSITPTTGNVCQGDIIVYTTTYNTGNSYNWTVTGGTCSGTACGTTAIGSGAATITVTWGSSGNGTISVTETKSAISGSDTKNYTVSPMPLTRTLTADPVCLGDSANVIITNSELNISYQLYLSSGVMVGSSHDGSSSDLRLPAGIPVATTSYYVMASNEGCSLRIPATPDYVTATVNPLPVPTITGNSVTCAGSLESFTTEGSMSDYTWAVTPGSGTITAPGNTSGISVTWGAVTGQYQDRIISVTYKNSNGCSSENPTEITVRVYKLPETGPSYHIPNEYNE